MSKKLIGAALLVGLITLANAQPMPPSLVNQCINIRWVGTTLEASCGRNIFKI